MTKDPRLSRAASSARNASSSGSASSSASSGSTAGSSPSNFSSTICTARAGSRRFGPLSALCAHTKAPYNMDFNRKALRALNRPGTARTVSLGLRRQILLRRAHVQAPDHCTDRHASAARNAARATQSCAQRRSWRGGAAAAGAHSMASSMRNSFMSSKSIFLSGSPSSS